MMKSFSETRVLRAMLVGALMGGSVLSMPLFADDAPAKEPLALKLPAPTMKGTPEDLPAGPNIDPPSDTPRPKFMVPKGVKNVALGKPVTSSVKPFSGELSQVTDGKKEALDSDTVEMKKGTQYVQIDLGDKYEIYAIAVWHDHRYIQVMHDVVLQVSDDPEFKTGVKTLFNNDLANACGLGAGTDREYFETNQGKLVDAKGVKGRYVRDYTNGSSNSKFNGWEEVEVYALPVTVKTP
ncbi:MAG: discoidin protein [Pedosphaera sp.]|nr:discoidin protein [Pedosphaera sp.]